MDCSKDVCEAKNCVNVFYTGIVLMEMGNCWCCSATCWFTRPYNFLMSILEVHGHQPNGKHFFQVQWCGTENTKALAVCSLPSSFRRIMQGFTKFFTMAIKAYCGYIKVGICHKNCTGGGLLKEWFDTGIPLLPVKETCDICL